MDTRPVSFAVGNIMRTFGFTLVLLSALPASAICRMGDAHVDPGTYTSELAALEAVARRHGRVWLREDREYAGVIFRTDNGVRISVAKGCRGVDRFRLRLDPRDNRIQALWHSHGGRGGLFRRWFSSDDRALVRKLGRPLYLFNPGGELRVLTPDQVDASSGPIRNRQSLLRSIPGTAGSLVQRRTGATKR